jgi:transcriptional regulator with XRE-family HTH domain
MLKTLIHKNGKSQWQICRELNWPEAKLSRFVTGRRLPSKDDIDSLAKVLGVSPEELQQSTRSTFNGRRQDAQEKN